MASSRLTDSQKQELVQRYRSGETSSALAEAYGCSVNTVSRTVRTLLSADDYNALKAARAKGGSSPAAAAVRQAKVEPAADRQVALDPVDSQSDQQLQALADAEDFGVDQDQESAEADAEDLNDDPANQFHEVAILTGITHADSHVPVATQSLQSGVLPESVYMLVDKVVELDPRPLSDFPELGSLDPADQDRQAICLFASPRTAKRQCGRNQRVIRVPDTSVFTRTSSYLLARGITRLVLEGSLIALDH